MITMPPPLLERWHRLAPSEKAGLRLVGAVVTAALLWLVLLAPALHTLKKAGTQRQALQRQLERMQRLQSQALALQSRPRVSPDTQVRTLELSLKPLGEAAQLQVSGSQAIVTLQQIPATALAQWLQQIQTSARMQPSMARLSRNAPAASWSGTVTFSLPTGVAPH